MGIIDRGKEGDNRMFIPPGVTGEPTVFPSARGVRAMTGELFVGGSAERAAEDCPEP